MPAPWQFLLAMRLGRLHPSKKFRERVLEPVFYELLEEYVSQHRADTPAWLKPVDQIVWSYRCGWMLCRLVPVKAQVAIATALSAAVAKYAL